VERPVFLNSGSDEGRCFVGFRTAAPAAFIESAAKMLMTLVILEGFSCAVTENVTSIRNG
jgi:hypothetical protein